MRRYQAHPEEYDPLYVEGEDFYDYVGQYRASERRRHLAAVWIAVGALLGGIIGISLLLLGAVR